MAKDPAFLFYPGDYLRDTQCLSEKTQVAYDRIMCEHMRNTSVDMKNIVISQDKVNFFTKRLSDDEKQELFTVLEKSENGYQIYWVAESIADRRMYSESRSNNRKKKIGTHEKTSLHMEDEDVIEDVIVKNNLLIPNMFAEFKKVLPDYPGDISKDFTPLGSVAKFILKQLKLGGTIDKHPEVILNKWKSLCQVIAVDNFYKAKTLSTISNQIQAIYQIDGNGNKQNTGSRNGQRSELSSTAVIKPGKSFNTSL